MPGRMTRIQQEMAKSRLDAILLTNLHNIRYLSGFTGSTATAIITRGRAFLLVDSRYTLQAAKECPEFDVRQYSGSALTAASDLLNEIQTTRIGFEADHITFNNHRKLRSMPAKGLKLVAISQIVEELRQIKDGKEIDKIRQAAAITDECFSYLLARVKPGMTERDVALDISGYVQKQGAKLAFDSIIAAGPHAAFPHAQPGDAVLAKGQMLKLDFGAAIDGYASDITRTIFIGRLDSKQKKVYKTVLDSQLKAIDAIKPGKLGKEIDAVARDYIKSQGYGDYFGHGLGHSLGLDVHDGPGFSPTSELVLAPGMVLTVEPGIYIEGWGGVRIEDDILVTDSGADVITKSTREIVIIK